MFCKYCGEKLDDKILEERHIAYCEKCGKLNKSQNKQLTEKEIDVSNCNTKIYQRDTGSVGWGILGFFFPLVGLILYLCWKNCSPRSANSAGAGALIAVALELVLALLYAVLALFTNIQLPSQFFY